jgi:hypothetical protein
VNLNEDTEFRDVTNILKQLQQVKAPSDFEADLIRRINSEEYPAVNTFRQNIFIPSRMIPAAALALTVFLLILVLNNSDMTRENPFSSVPRERQDVTLSLKTNNVASVEENKVEKEGSSTRSISGTQEGVKAKDEAVEKVKSKESPGKYSVKGTIAGKQPVNDKYITVGFASGRIKDYHVNKKGLNFRHVNLSNAQRAELNHLKEKLERESKSTLKQ